VSSIKVRSRRLDLRVVIIVGACAPVLAGCATGFGSPTRHAVANLQAARASVGTTLQIQDAIIALPNGRTSVVGGDAYLEFDAINFGSVADELEPNLTIDGVAAVAGSAGPVASPVAVASRLYPSSATTIPAATGSAPGTARVVIALLGLQLPLQQGQTVDVAMSFEQSGSIADLQVPVQGASVVGSSFLPTGPPSLPAAATPTAVASAVASQLASAPASGQPQSSAVAGSAAPSVSPPPSASPSPASS
jgi:hypothetical protein